MTTTTAPQQLEFLSLPPPTVKPNVEECHCGRFPNRRGKKMPSQGRQLSWIPPDGIDPRLRKFRCKRCEGIFYRNISTSRLGQPLPSQVD